VEFPYEHGGRTLLYGSNTRDNNGRFYVAVRRRYRDDIKAPVILRIDTAD
jgi:hypothetical protein